MSGIIRKKNVGEAWETVVDDGGGGGGSQDLAQVLAVGGDPDGNPITGTLVITPPDDTANPLILQNAAAQNRLVVVKEGGGTVVEIDSHDPGDVPLQIFAATGQTVNVVEAWGDGASESSFTVGPTGAVTISPSDDSVGLAVIANGMTVVQKVNGSGGFTLSDADENPLASLDNLGNLGAKGAFIGNAVTVIQVDADQLGFFDEGPVAQPVVPLTLPTVQDVIDALVALGLVSQHD